MTFYKSISIWKLAPLLLCLYFAPHSLNNSFKHASHKSMQIFSFLCSYDFNYFLLMVASPMVSAKSETFLHKALSALEKNICNASPFGTILLCCFFIFWRLTLSLFWFMTMFQGSDEIAQLFQAKIFLGGNLYVPAPPLPEFFTYAEDNMIVSPQWYSQYPQDFLFCSW